MSPQPYLEEDKVKKSMTLRGLLARLWPLLRRHRAELVVIFILVLIFAAAGRLIPIVFGRAIDDGIQKNALDVVYWCSGIYVGLEFLRVGLHFLLAFLMEKLGHRIMFELRERLVRHVQQLPMSYFDKNPSGRIVTRLTNDVLSLGDLFSQGFTAIFMSVVELAAITLTMTAISPLLTVATMAITPVALYTTLKLSMRLRHYFGESKKKMAAMNAYTAESLNGLKVLQLFGRVAFRESGFQGHSKDYRDLQLHTVRFFAMLWPVIGFFNMFTVGLALLTGARYFSALGLTVGELSAFLILVQSFYSPIRVILEQNNQFQNSLAGADRIFHMLAQPVEPYERGTALTARLRGEILFENLNFRYLPDGPWTLKNINLRVRPGESVALVGRTGSGKTTMTSLLMRFYEPQQGRILVDDMDVQGLRLTDLRDHIRLVQQDNYIFQGTLFHNIGLGDPRVTRAKAEEALRRAHGEALLTRTPAGLDMMVSERGGNLSVGERQLLAFARIVAFDTDILILDEATSNIDSLSELKIQKAIRDVSAGRTSLIVAHRLSTIVHCDRILVMSDGEIAEEGTHTELLARGGLYAKLHRQV